MRSHFLRSKNFFLSQICCADFCSHRINANAYKGAFWTLAYVLQDQSLVAALRAEFSPIFAKGTANLDSRLEGCPLLEAVYLEALRLSSSSATIRNVRKTTTLDEVTLKKGVNILVPYRQLHHNEDVFGENTEQFNPGRFLKNTHLKRSPSFKPFGGGTTYYPGRFLARREFMSFVAILLHRFDVSLAPPDRSNGGKERTIPRMDTKKLSIALMSPIHGDDVMMSVKLAKNWVCCPRLVPPPMNKLSLVLSTFRLILV